MSERIKTNFVHKLGTIVICTGIGDKYFGAYIEKKNGSLKRFCPIEESEYPGVIERRLHEYKGKALMVAGD
jgi:hypothetical protein